MGKNKIENEKKNLGNKQSNNYKKLIIMGVAVISMFALIGCSSVSKSSVDNTKNTTSNNSDLSNNSNSSSSNKESNSEATKKATSNIVPGIEINESEISATVKFYPYEANGIKMEVLALKAKDGTIRTALNTCQVCYASGKGYYVQEGDELVCQNCGNRFASNMVGKAKGGCNPVPISDTSKTDDGNKITIDKNFLDKNKAYFSHWKA
jgi:uncharacterized protein YcfL